MLTNLSLTKEENEMQRSTNNVSILNRLTTIEDYFPLYLDRILQLYALKIKERQEEIDSIVSRSTINENKLKRFLAFFSFLGRSFIETRNPRWFSRHFSTFERRSDRKQQRRMRRRFEFVSVRFRLVKTFRRTFLEKSREKKWKSKRKKRKQKENE